MFILILAATAASDKVYCDAFHASDSYPTVLTAAGPGFVKDGLCIPSQPVVWPGWWTNCLYMTTWDHSFNRNACGPALAVVRFEAGSFQRRVETKITCCELRACADPWHELTHGAATVTDWYTGPRCTWKSVKKVV